MRKIQNQRIFELDFLRGFVLLMMCLDHLAYDFYCLPFWFPFSDSEWIETLGKFGDTVAFSSWRLALHYIFATVFLLLAGIGSALTKRPLKRMGQIAFAALGITVVTVLLDLFFDLGTTILFGVLSTMAVGTFLCWVCSLFGEKIGKYVALGLGILMIFIGFSLPWYDAPILYSVGWEDLLDISLGKARFGADWFPVFPCAGVVAVGYFLGKILYRKKQSLIPALRGKSNPLCVVGRYPLWIYLLHQPVLVGILYLLIFIVVRN